MFVKHRYIFKIELKHMTAYTATDYASWRVKRNQNSKNLHDFKFIMYSWS